MRRIDPFLICFSTSLLLYAGPLQAQQSPAPTAAEVPRLVRVSGSFRPANGLPPAPVEIVTLAIYAEQTGGTPLWQETQNVIVDGNGQYTLLLGAMTADGLPQDLFARGDARWLAVHFERPGEIDQPRVLLASVPYALRASDADTLGGRPASAYLLAPSAADGGTRTATSTTDASTTNGTQSMSTANVVLAGTPNFLAKYVNGADVGTSAVYESGGAVGIGTATPFDSLHVRFNNTTGSVTGFAVQNLGNTATSYSGMLFYDQNGALGQFQGFNNVTHEYRINNIASGGSINFMLGSSSKFLVANTGDISIAGNLLKNGSPFFHTFGTNNTFAGLNAGNFTTTGTGGNAAFGTSALVSNSTGEANTATGAFAMASNTAGFWNTAAGGAALATNDSGSWNAAFGAFALSASTGDANTAYGNESLESNTTGCCNIAVGSNTLQNNTIGSSNTALGDFAGLNATTGSNNIYIGANVVGVAGESNTMYLGLVGTQTKAFIAGVRGITTGAADAVAVMIDSNGQLGTVSSSRRYKEDIRDMGDASDGLMKLRPVTFRYTRPYSDGSKPVDYGLIAEEVEQVYPDLVAHLSDGQVETVQYHKINAMLLNEVQKQHRQLEQQRNEIETQRTEIELLKARLAALEGQRQ